MALGSGVDKVPGGVRCVTTSVKKNVPVASIFEGERVDGTMRDDVDTPRGKTVEDEMEEDKTCVEGEEKTFCV